MNPNDAGATTLLSLVESFRNLARMVLRLRWINNVKDTMANHEKTITSLTDSKAGYTKRIARNDYALSKLDPLDPDFDTKEKNLKSDNEEYVKFNESYDKDIESVKKVITEQEDKIAKIESGELKVDAENLSIKAKELAEEYGKFQATQVK